MNEALTKGKVSFVGFKVIVGLSYNVGFKLKWVLILVLFYVGFDVRPLASTSNQCNVETSFVGSLGISLYRASIAIFFIEPVVPKCGMGASPSLLPAFSYRRKHLQHPELCFSSKVIGQPSI